MIACSTIVSKGGDLGGEPVDVGKHHRQDGAVMIGEEPAQRLLQLCDLRPEVALGQLREHPRVALPGDQRVQDQPPGHPEQLTDHRGQRDLGVLEQLLRPLHLPGAIADQTTPVPGQVA
ncbi:hypothetical protein [Micromonospora rhizosphaerae]|uniref:hypothetical protein n=1 Tax=Micromonospora rhizosphaerae TaxID=568872 RepID=UPI001C404ADE|nr:hypothetical protein [Micromonospora rhizosphaerae]